jgi:hypothetical protein
LKHVSRLFSFFACKEHKPGSRLNDDEPQASGSATHASNTEHPSDDDNHVNTRTLKLISQDILAGRLQSGVRKRCHLIVREARNHNQQQQQKQQPSDVTHNKQNSLDGSFSSKRQKVII